MRKHRICITMYNLREILIFDQIKNCTKVTSKYANIFFTKLRKCLNKISRLLVENFCYKKN